DGLATHDFLYPARWRERHCRRPDIAWSAHVADQGGLSSPLVGSGGRLGPISLIPTLDCPAVLAALQQSRRLSAHDTIRDGVLLLGSGALCPPICTRGFPFLRPMSLASCIARSISARSSPRGCRTVRAMPPRWLDLAKGRLRLDRLCRNGGGETFFPRASPIPREARKSHRRRPPLRFGPKMGAASIAFGLQIAIEAAMVAGSNIKEK